MITAAQLLSIAPSTPRIHLEAITQSLNEVAALEAIDTPLRMAAFLSQLLHESGQFHFRSEIWGPTPAQNRYEGRRDLGNTRAGDGYRFRGRGWLQLTGRANYRTYGKQLGIDLENHPDWAAADDIAMRVAGLYWRLRGINKRADRADLEAVTRAVNGGLNGLSERRVYYRAALDVLQSMPARAPRRVFLEGAEVTGRRIALQSGVVVNAVDSSRIYVYTPVKLRVTPSSVPDAGRVFLNAVEITGQRVRSGSLTVNALEAEKLFVEIA